MLAVLLAEPETKAYLKAAFAPANASNWVLAVLGTAGGVTALMTLFIIWRQAVEMRRQRVAMQQTLMAIQRQAKTMEEQSSAISASARAAEVSAEAAKTSADIAAGVSVPTLVVSEFGMGDVGDANTRAILQAPKIKMSIKNYGQTPAFLKWWTLCFSCEALSETPNYDDGPADGMILDKIVVEPSATFTLPQLFYPHRQMFSDEDVEAMMKREKTLHAYGYICYGDIFGNPLRRIKFCETVLNIFEGDGPILDWWEGFAPRAYTGVEQFPAKEPTQQNSVEIN